MGPSPSPSPQPTKKIKLGFAKVSDGTIWHQDTALHFILSSDCQAWENRCITTLFATTEHSQFALHLRQSCNVTAIRVNEQPVSFTHVDPLTRILVIPPSQPQQKIDQADGSRGTSGMSNGLRAASITANISGNLRISLPSAEGESSSLPQSEEEWKTLFEGPQSTTDCPLVHSLPLPDSSIRQKRMKRLANELSKSSQQKTYIIRIEYTIANFSTAGITHLPNIPALYTTSGVHGDHQGPQFWLPVQDASRHRWTHTLAITATAPLHHGIGIAGCGQDAGVTESILHTSHWKENLGSIVASLFPLEQMEENMLIPPDDETPDTPTLFATAIWRSHIYLPVSARSLGFAIGPFRIIPDKNDENSVRQVLCLPRQYRAAALLATARRVVPVVATAATSTPAPPPKCLGGTTGVAGTALRLLHQVLAISYRTESYTQIWLPVSTASPFLGGAILDSRLLEEDRLPYYAGGRALQFHQAGAVVEGWVTAALPLGSGDDVGDGYLWSVVTAILWSLYERGHGAVGEGSGDKDSWLHCAKFFAGSGLNSPNLDFLPVQNIEDTDVVIEGVGAVPVEDRINDQLWRGPSNGTESHTSGIDEFNIRQLLVRDAIEAIERGHDREKKPVPVPLPSWNWTGSFLSLSFLSSNAASSSDLGCGAVELMHPVGGLMYRKLKSELFRQVLEGRAGIANLIRVVRAAFIASFLQDTGESELKIPRRRQKAESSRAAMDSSAHKPGEASTGAEATAYSSHPFVVCVNEIVKKKGLTHNLFTRALLNLGGPMKEAQLRGTFGVDADPRAVDPRTRQPFLVPEGFPNSYVRGASMFYCRVGVQVEACTAQSQTSKGIQLQAFAEPIIPEGGIAYSGAVTMRVVENEGQFREYTKDLAENGSRRDWGASFLHAKPVTTIKAQASAGGTVDSSSSDSEKPKVATLYKAATGNAFNEVDFHSGGYQAIELIRLTNLTPLLWVRVDPLNQYGGKIAVYQPDACLAEQVYHDGDAAAQVEALRALAERPLRIQTNNKVTVVYGVNVSELPARVLGDCLRGSPALHSSLPHTPSVRAQAAFALAQWQNNRAPASRETVGPDNWVGINLLVQYFRERFTSDSTLMPNRFTRLSVKKSEVSGIKAPPGEGNAGNSQLSDGYTYLDLIDPILHKEDLESAEAIELEEDEEYRVRSAVITAVACIKARDGLTPTLGLELLEAVLDSSDAETSGNLCYSDKGKVVRETYSSCNARLTHSVAKEIETCGPPFTFLQSMLVADTLLALSYVRAEPAIITDPETGKQVQTSGAHPLSRLVKSAHNWLNWELLRENLRIEEEEKTNTGLSGNASGVVTACAVIGLSNLAILVKCTTDVEKERAADCVGDASSSQFYLDIFDSKPIRNDATRAACAQAFLSICCATDRLKKKEDNAIGLLTGLEEIMRRILDPTTSTNLRHILASLLMDACTGKICSTQRVGVFVGRHDLISSALRFYTGPLGACYGGDNGATVTIPASAAVTDGARNGLRTLMKAGHPKETHGPEIVIRVAKLGTQLWRTVNGENAANPGQLGVCAFDGALRCSLLALWQWLWPRGCIAVLQVQSWKSAPFDISGVMQQSESEKTPAASADRQSLMELSRIVGIERERQEWRGEMHKKVVEFAKKDPSAINSGIGHPLPPIERDEAFRLGGWIAAASQQRRSQGLDGGINVRKINLQMKTSDS